MTRHIKHRDDDASSLIYSYLCGGHVYVSWTWKDSKGNWAYGVEPTCTVCILLAMVEPETVYHEVGDRKEAY